MAEKELALCDECGSLFFKGSSQMMGLCPECAHILYGYPNCDHHFQDGRCVNCYWDGSKSVYIKKQNQQEETDMPTTEWLNKYESIKDKLTCKVDLEAHFTEKVIGNMAVDVLDIGTVHFPITFSVKWASKSTLQVSLSLMDSYLFSHSVVGISVSSC